VTNTSFELNELNQALIEWEIVYGSIRPHQALGYLTPGQYLDRHRRRKGRGGVPNHVNEYNPLTVWKSACNIAGGDTLSIPNPSRPYTAAVCPIPSTLPFPPSHRAER